MRAFLRVADVPCVDRSPLVAIQNFLQFIASSLTTSGDWLSLGSAFGGMMPIELTSWLPVSAWTSLSVLRQVILSSFVAAVDFSAMLDFPPWTETLFAYTGLVLLVLGLMAWFGSHSTYRRSWGRRLTLSGSGLFVVGMAFGTFVDLLEYVLG